MGTQHVQTALAASGPHSFQHLGAEAADSGDLGYTYGKYRALTSEEGAEEGHYVRVWKRASGTGPWRLVLDVMLPLPPKQ